MGRMVQPSAWTQRATREADRERPCGAKRPEQMVAQFWHQDPERTAHGAEGGISVALWHCPSDSPAEYERPALDHFHVVTMRLQEFRAERWQNGRLIREQDTRPGSSSFTFAGIAPRSVIYGSWRSLQVYVPTSLLVETAHQTGLPMLEPDRLERGLIYDPALAAIGRSVLGEMEQGRPGSRLQLDSLATMLCVHLLRRTGSACLGAAGARGGLARWQVKRAMDCVADRLGENLTLAALAEEVGLSQYHFARAFKQSTGFTPHRYLLYCRLERAKELLANSDASVADIAARVGYSEATQLSRLFQAELAMSPTAYRRLVAPRYAEAARLDGIANSARNVSL
jgi:AraC family transcriptional regulator